MEVAAVQYRGLAHSSFYWLESVEAGCVFVTYSLALLSANASP